MKRSSASSFPDSTNSAQLPRNPEPLVGELPPRQPDSSHPGEFAEAHAEEFDKMMASHFTARAPASPSQMPLSPTAQQLQSGAAGIIQTSTSLLPIQSPEQETGAFHQMIQEPLKPSSAPALDPRVTKTDVRPTPKPSRLPLIFVGAAVLLAIVLMVLFALRD